MSSKALIVIDVQNEYFPGGAWALPDAEKALPNILQLIEKARGNGTPVAFIRHLTPAGSPVFAKDSKTSELHPALPLLPGDKIIEKNHPSSFQDTDLLDWLKKNAVDAVDICGFMTQMCCDTTSREAYRTGFKVRLFSDACAAKPLSHAGVELSHEMVHRVSLAALAAFAQVLETADA